MYLIICLFIFFTDELRAGVTVSEEGGGGGEEGGKDGKHTNRSPTRSDSMVSTASSSSGEVAVHASQRKGWVNFDDDSFAPPLPPPRSQLEVIHAGAGAIHANPAVVNEGEHVVNFSKASATTAASTTVSGRTSPFEDFSAEVAQTLFSQSRNRTSLDAYTANVMASASRDIYMALDASQTISERRDSQTSLPEPLIPSSSSASVSSVDSTYTSNTLSTNPFAPPLKSTANGFPSSPSHPLVQREWVRPRGPPPPKPQPYSGKPVSTLQLPRTDDPFGNLLGGISMQAYASSSPGGTKCNSPTAQLRSNSTSPGPAAVEPPLV